MQRILTIVTWVTHLCLRSLHHRFVAWTKPDTTSLMLGTLTDLVRSKSELVAENALLRQQLIILRRQVKRPACTKTDRMLLVLLSTMVRTWKQALVIVQPETLLRWHRQGFKLFWKYKSRAASFKPRLSQETISLIQEMARNNRLWGAERIRGELLIKQQEVVRQRRMGVEPTEDRAERPPSRFEDGETHRSPYTSMSCLLAYCAIDVCCCQAML